MQMKVYGPENIRKHGMILCGLKNAIIRHKHQIDCVITSDLGCWDEISRKLWRRWKNFNGVT